MSARDKMEHIRAERNEGTTIETASLLHNQQRAPRRRGTPLICGMLRVLALGCASRFTR